MRATQQITRTVPIPANGKVSPKLEVQTTYDYEKFKSLDGNRNINPLHLRRLIESMKQHYLFSPIIVNEKFQIIDGQHRHAACAQLKEPVYYIVKHGYGLHETHILNMNSKVWNADDFMNGYADLGYKEYVNYKAFKDKYGFGHHECMALLANVNTGANSDRTKRFYSGAFKVTSLERAERIAKRVLQLEPLYSGYKRRSFIYAIAALDKNKSFSFKEFKNKVELQPGKLVDCPTTASYLQLIEEIYNYRRREKVNLRYNTK